ncbi:MAG: aminodeoxychorismate synthase component I [Pyrinomonadaceae bacterium]
MGEKSTNLEVSADELVARLLSLEASAKLALLDSCGRSLGGSKFLIAGIYPTETFEYNCQTQRDAFAALQFLDEKLQFYQTRQDPTQPFGGGICVATFAYEFGPLLEDLRLERKESDRASEPSVTLTFYETFVVHDYSVSRSFIVGKQAQELAKILDGRISILKHHDVPMVLRKPTELPAQFVSSNFTENEYLAAVEKIRQHIMRGDIYQANLTQQLCLKLPENIESEQVFLNLRRSHPAPFAAFLRRANDCVVSASPERFFKVQSPKSKAQGRIITTSPIKGTRRRGKTPEEDLLLRRELEQSSKDKAENVMIVDLLRNDLGRVCEFGSVKAEKLFEIEEHPTLFHLVSSVRGCLRKNAEISDLLKAAFPCGSITGAPKIRAMQILHEIETAPRGLSMGALGYFAFDGSADLSVAIRTMTICDRTAVFNVGGGIVFDSQPESEYEESWLKAQALLNATGINIPN